MILQSGRRIGIGVAHSGCDIHRCFHSGLERTIDCTIRAARSVPWDRRVGRVDGAQQAEREGAPRDAYELRVPRIPDLGQLWKFLVVLALPRGGLPVAIGIARALRAPLENPAGLLTRQVGRTHAPDCRHVRWPSDHACDIFALLIPNGTDHATNAHSQDGIWLL